MEPRMPSYRGFPIIVSETGIFSALRTGRLPELVEQADTMKGLHEKIDNAFYLYLNRECPSCGSDVSSLDKDGKVHCFNENCEWSGLLDATKTKVKL
jgi:hypothetical protein